jgi:hypothetical protein
VECRFWFCKCFGRCWRERRMVYRGRIGMGYEVINIRLLIPLLRIYFFTSHSSSFLGRGTILGPLKRRALQRTLPKPIPPLATPPTTIIARKIIRLPPSEHSTPPVCWVAPGIASAALRASPTVEIDRIRRSADGVSLYSYVLPSIRISVPARYPFPVTKSYSTSA